MEIVNLSIWMHSIDFHLCCFIFVAFGKSTLFVRPHVHFLFAFSIGIASAAGDFAAVYLLY